MKNIVMLSCIVMALVIGFSSCGGTPPAQTSSTTTTEAAPPPAPPPAAVIVAEIADAFNRHHNDIILDGAVKYTVKSGDRLVDIAKVYYRSGFDYPLILLASDIVTDHDVIEPGMVLTIPDLNRNLNDARAKKSIKEFLGEMAAIEDQRGRSGTATGLREEAGRL